MQFLGSHVLIPNIEAQTVIKVLFVLKRFADSQLHQFFLETKTSELYEPHSLFSNRFLSSDNFQQG